MCLLLVSVRWQFSCYDLERRRHSSAHTTQIARRKAAAMDAGRGYGKCSSSGLRRCGCASAALWSGGPSSRAKRNFNEAWLPRSFSMLGDPSANSAPNRPSRGHLNRRAGTGPSLLQRSSIFGSFVSLRRPSRQRPDIRLGDPSQIRIPGGIVVVADLSPRVRTGHTSFEGGA
jgi:hypothetical protein